MKEKPDMTSYRGMYAAELDSLGREILDPYPLFEELEINKPMTTEERLKRFLLSEQLKRAAENSGFDTPEEANDFDIDDDDNLLPLSNYEFEDTAFVEEEPKPVATKKSKKATEATQEPETPLSQEGAEGDPERSEG